MSDQQDDPTYNGYAVAAGLVAVALTVANIDEKTAFASSHGKLFWLYSMLM